ncbi:hemerythrin domain-containing protein [Amycolatopsis keratiniphila]|uniref:hemerythrin domain-containing protein n=1 Tax=Amycolatopsis keratiniphila TaxID=129921 RepID=UPI0033FF50DF
MFAPDDASPWYRDLLASPQATLEIDGVPHAARAVPLEGDERGFVLHLLEVDAARGRAIADQLLGHCVTFCNDLRMHHLREDGAFTAIRKAHPGLAPALERLRREHETVSRALLDLDALLQGGGDLDAVREKFERVAAGLEEHFAYEEANLLPALRGSGVPAAPVTPSG